jgi:hypothetical protein
MVGKAVSKKEEKKKDNKGDRVLKNLKGYPFSFLRGLGRF